MEGENEKSSTKQIKSLQTTFGIIEFIRQNERVRASEVVDEFDLAPSTVHYYLTTLVHHRVLVKEETSYHLGLRFLTLGGEALASNPLYPAVDEGVRELVSETGESVQMAVMEHGRCIYIYHVPGAGPISDTRHIGTEMPPHATAAGKAMLSMLSSNTVNEILASSELPEITSNTLTDREDLAQELKQIQEEKVAFENQEADEEMNAIAAPIVQDEELLGAIELSLPATRIHDPRQREKKEGFSGELVQLVHEAARRIQSVL